MSHDQIVATVVDGYRPFYHECLRLRECAGLWRLGVFDECRRGLATCGFYAALAILSQERYNDFWEVHACGERGLEEGISLEDVMIDVQGLDLGVGLGCFEVIDMEDHQIAVLRVLHLSELHPGRMLVYTPVDGEGNRRSHWLACTSFNRDKAIWLPSPGFQYRQRRLLELMEVEHRIASEVEQLALRIAQEQEEKDQLIHQELQWASRLAEFLLAEPDVRPVRQADEDEDDLFSFTPVLPRIPMPRIFPRKSTPGSDEPLVCVGVRPFPFKPSLDLVCTKRWYKIGAGPVIAANVLVVSGAPGPLTRALPGGSSRPILWEFHPSVIAAGMHVRAWHKVYITMGPVQYGNDELLTSGCYNPEVISVLDCGVAVYDLIDPVTVQLPVGHMLLFSLSLRHTSVIGAASLSIPLLRHKVHGVQRRSLHPSLISLPSPSSFPNRRAYVKAVMEHLFRTAPLHLKATVESNTRSLLAELEAGTLSDQFDFVRLMHAIAGVAQFASHLSGGPGMAISC